MMSAELIRSESRKAAKRAAHEGLRPYIVEQDDLDAWRSGVLRRFPFPFIGGYVPKDYRRTDNLYFVDSSGFGEPGEPALTAGQLVDKLRVGYAYAVVEYGQFQVYVQEYVPTRYKRGAVPSGRTILVTSSAQARYDRIAEGR